MGGNCRCI